MSIFCLSHRKPGNALTYSRGGNAVLQYHFQLENYVDAIEAIKDSGCFTPEMVKCLTREGKLTATKFGNKWIREPDRLQVFANTYGGGWGRTLRQARTRQTLYFDDCAMVCCICPSSFPELPLRDKPPWPTGRQDS